VAKVAAVRVDARTAQVDLAAEIQWKPKGASSWMRRKRRICATDFPTENTLRSRFGASGEMVTSSARRRGNGERVGAMVTSQPLLGREKLRRV
jgi:hypothetical protein